MVTARGAAPLFSQASEIAGLLRCKASLPTPSPAGVEARSKRLPGPLCRLGKVPSGSGCPSLAESGTLQPGSRKLQEASSSGRLGRRLEMRYLSHVTGDQTFAAKTMKFYASQPRFYAAKRATERG